MKKRLVAPLKRVSEAWNQFWFDSRSEQTLVVISAFRLVFCLVMFFCYLSRIPDIAFFYTPDGILPNWHRTAIPQLQYNFSFLSDAIPVWGLHTLHGLLLLLLLMQAAGLFTRFSAVAGYVLHLAFLHRNPGVMFGVDMIATFFLLYLCFADSNARFSLDSIWGRGCRHQSLRGHIAWRLMQIQLCVIYGFSGLEKLRGTRWWDGSALWDVLSIGNMQRWDLSFVVHAPLLLASVVYIVLFFEIYFPVLVWLRGFRLPMLFFGLTMHIGIYVFMNLPSFGFMMISLYILFLRAEEVESGMHSLRHMLRLNRAVKPIPSRN